MRAETVSARRRLYLLSRVVVTRHYRRELTLVEVARALACSPRQLQRAYAQFGGTTFREDLLVRRMRVAAQLLLEQRYIPVEDVARLVGYSDGQHFARAFRRRYGLSPARFRRAALDAKITALQAQQRRPATSRSGAYAPAVVQAGERS